MSFSGEKDVRVSTHSLPPLRKCGFCGHRLESFRTYWVQPRVRMLGLAYSRTWQICIALSRVAKYSLTFIGRSSSDYCSMSHCSAWFNDFSVGAVLKVRSRFKPESVTTLQSRVFMKIDIRVGAHILTTFQSLWLIRKENSSNSS